LARRGDAEQEDRGAGVPGEIDGRDEGNEDLAAASSCPPLALSGESTLPGVAEDVAVHRGLRTS
jgi:hypothetical protein